ncbi:MAG: FG-GAP-like repeat-containing protein [Planctomycetota bacterium]|jgi:hypothetical protein
MQMTFPSTPRDGCARTPCAAAILLATLLAATPARAGELTVVSVSPSPNGMTAPVGAAIQVQFDRPVDPVSVNGESVRAFGRWSGPVGGTLELSDGDQTVTLTPDAPFSAGETVTVTLSHDLKGGEGSPLRGAGYSWQFWTVAAAAPDLDFTEIADMTTRTIPSESSRAYGGIGTDLDNDGYLDLTIVNEDTADLRVFMNLADGTGQYAPFTQPTYPVNDRASPSEPADFNHDGNADIAVVNINTNSVSILLGAGNGMFLPQQEVGVQGAPRGIAVLDVDGDGDTDIVNTNSSTGTGGNLSLLLNNGGGVFGLPSFFDGGVIGEWSLASADMNGDGILDLVVGGNSGEQLNVLLGNGDGTFTPQTPQSAGGNTWMLALGDVNGDGRVDASTVNSSDNNGAILFGTGAGGLAPPQIYSTSPDGFPLATDLGDADGDGDLDWVTSSFGGDWRLYVNNGSGVFAFDQEFDAPLAASCALLLDIDNDRDLDLALVDELADRVILLRNSGPVIPGDIDGDGTVDINDLLLLLGDWGPCPGCAADLDGDDVVGINDLLLLLANWS